MQRVLLVLALLRVAPVRERYLSASDFASLQARNFRERAGNTAAEGREFIYFENSGEESFL